MDNDTLIKNRFNELSQRSFNRGIWTFSEFLSLAEQDVLLSMRLPCPFSLYGGTDSAERRIAVFGSEELCGWIEPPPVECIKIAPAQQKFADKLSHRDFLGSLMALGLRREVLGDIEISDNTGYLFCLNTISDYIIDNLSEVRHTTVRCCRSEPPEALSVPPEPTELVVASERLDALIAAVYRLSRSEAQELIAHEKVFLSGRLPSGAAAQVSPGTIVSVRGSGRFKYEGLSRETRKGRLRVTVRIYK
ncbi:MAG: YlmH/Sll1252 family protein [Oscillospiraceae bacterium]